MSSTGSRRTLRRWGTAFLCGLLAGVGGLAVPPSQAAAPACSNGLVALTFDDGPATAVTGRLLDVLSSRRVPATFFVLGQRVAASPALVRRAGRLGFVVANHTYGHEMLTRLPDEGIRRTVRATTDRIRAAGAQPAPFGSSDDPLEAPLPVDLVSFSGGVAEYVFGRERDMFSLPGVQA